MIYDLYNNRYLYPRLFKIKQLERLIKIKVYEESKGTLKRRPLGKLKKEIKKIGSDISALEKEYKFLINNKMSNNILGMEKFAKKQGNNYADFIYSQIINDER